MAKRRFFTCLPPRISLREQLVSQYFSEQLQSLQEKAQASGLAFRRAAVDIFQTYGMPRRKQDPWKYVDNSALLDLECGMPQERAERLKRIRPLAGEGGQHWHFVAERLEAAPAGSKLLGLLPEDLGRSGDWQLDRESLQKEENSYSLINAFSFPQAYQLEVRGRVQLNFCGLQSYQAPRLYVQIPAGTEAEVLLDTRGLGPTVYWNPYFFFEVGSSARLTLLERGPRLSLSEPADNAAAGPAGSHVRSVTLRGSLGEGALLNGALFYWGSRLAIHDSRFAITGPDAELRMRGLCFGEGRSAYHLRCEHQHLAPDSQSLCLYKNVLFDKSTSEFYGIIHADNNGAGTQAEQRNQNLLLSDEARAIARPQLEILIDDLKCSHASSTGSIDAEELFYMCSRGLSQNEALRLAVVGFVEEISTYFERELIESLGIEDCLQALLAQRAGGIG